MPMSEVISLKPGGVIARRWGCTCPRPSYDKLPPEASMFSCVCPMHAEERDNGDRAASADWTASSN